MKLISKFLCQVSRANIPTNPKSNKVFLHNIPWFSGSKEIKKSLESYGEISNIKIFENREAITHLGLAEVEFKNSNSMNNLLKIGKIKVDGFDVIVRNNNK
ncbi:RNA recognition motif domain and Nucleotide-binding, alpha-beta plait domain-containing protein [Strongyloides ratti]|uniref:RNA recognition motif domain and Nucleotide-binding, alpha-beta plait domain-containing protein n=1 Tax=Strongyloides ratti TaxID=34506 RepID=A0A090LIZ6_STRRB|nr:RNA recognition motif domain and Nucleotide-binding, alpha-beta plait domain-containing protein [Strongyloides ratti]CEF69777.1 RNA recognition motif domain and Nucleotide-binding, alpha-beta plait domain-containing protein [Strongyloides ratti]